MVDRGYSVAEVSERLGVSAHSLYKWVKAVKPDKTDEQTAALIEARSKVVGWMRTKGLSESKALRIVKMSASALRYRRRMDRNVELRQKIVALAQRHRHYGAGMIYLKLRQAGEIVNYKRVERLYAEENIQIKRRKREKVPIADRQPLERPDKAN